jgi:hypothetical protein
MMTRITLAWFLALAAALPLGCSRKPDQAATPKVSHSDPNASARPADVGGSSAGDPSPWPAGDAASSPDEHAFTPPDEPTFAPPEERIFSAPNNHAFAPPDEHIYAAPAEGPDLAMAEPPMAVPRSAVPRSAVPLAPETSSFAAPSAEPSADPAPDVPRINRNLPSAPESSYRVVEVFYGTDRARVSPDALEARDYLHHYRAAVGLLAATLVLSGSLLLGQKNDSHSGPESPVACWRLRSALPLRPRPCNRGTRRGARSSNTAMAAACWSAGLRK